MQALEFVDNSELISKAFNLASYFYKVFDEGCIALLAVLNEDKLGFLGIRDKKAYYISTEGEDLKVLEMGFDDEWSLEYFVSNDDVYVFDEDAVCFQNKQGVIEELRCLNMDYVDEDDYNGRIMYTQINQNNDTNIELHYAFNYFNNERIGHPYIYDNKIKNATYVFLTDNNKKGIRSLPGIGSKYNYYVLYDMPKDSRGAFLFSNESDLEEDEIIRYLRIFTARNCEYTDAWPLGGAKTKQEMNALIEKYGFKSEIPRKLIDVYNQDDDDYKLCCDLINVIKEVVNNKEEEKQVKMTLHKE